MLFAITFYPREVATFGISPWGDLMFGLVSIMSVILAIKLGQWAHGNKSWASQPIVSVAAVILVLGGLGSILWSIFSVADLLQQVS